MAVGGMNDLGTIYNFRTLLPQYLAKVDGLPVELIYRSGRFFSAATRGNGRYGVDVTGRVREITADGVLTPGQ